MGAAIFGWLVTAPRQKRRDEWEKRIGEAVGHLMRNNGIPMEEIQKNQVFQDCVNQATLIALRHHQQEKHQALKNVVLGAAQPGSDYETFMQMALNLIDTFTLWHIQILKLLVNPRQWEKEKGIRFPQTVFDNNVYMLIRTAFPELQEDEDLYKAIVRELFSRGLLESEPPREPPKAGEGYEEMMRPHTTPMGNRFLALFGGN